MNWLAHVFLSEPALEFRLGNLLADLVRGEDRQSMPAAFLRGVERHKAIDAFTDAHPIVRLSRSRLSARHRRFSGVLIDIFYDYFLARSWTVHCDEPLELFTATFYAQVKAHPLPLPDTARVTLDRIVEYDLLGQYRHLDGVENSLRRVSGYITKRWQRNYELEASVSELVANEAELAEDFARFFPELQRHVAAVKGG